jgi:hypothetical protein
MRLQMVTNYTQDGVYLHLPRPLKFKEVGFKPTKLFSFFFLADERGSKLERWSYLTFVSEATRTVLVF